MREEHRTAREEERLAREKGCVPSNKVPDCFKKYTPLPPFVQKTDVENAIDVCLDVCGIFGEERTHKLIEINKRLGLWDLLPCMK